VKPLIWSGLGVVLVIVVGTGGWTLMRGSGPIVGSGATYLEASRDYGAVPDFTLIERDGSRVSLEDLAGRFWVADFIFTRCNGICPILTRRMASLARKLPDDDIRFVSFSVDPSWDTPEVLSGYAASSGVETDRWLFLTGPRDDIHRLVGDGFHLSVAERAPDAGDDGELITHSDRFVLIDPEGTIRGYYHGTDEEAVDRLIEDLRRLRRDSRGS
jgi:cytochrome oxidase Cu insertion factor (SCO1/SenC/PrrC family)